MDWLNNPVSLSASIGHDSPNRLIWEYKSTQNAIITIMAMHRVIIMAITLFIFFRTKKFTTGCNTIEIMIAKTIGMIMPWAMYNIVNKANKPTKKMVAFI